MGDTKNVRIISIEGNIGSGKSTFLKNLQEHYSKESNDNIIFVDEPVDEWNDICDNENETILSKFYKDSEKYSFPFQMMAFITRYNKLKKAMEYAKQIIDKNPIIITERSLYTDKYVFAKMLYDDNKMEEINFQIYNKWFEEFASEFPITKIIYIKTNPEICFERIKKRSRNGESNIPLIYLENCHNYHNIMIQTQLKEKKIVKILDGNNDINDNNSYNEMLSKSINFVS